MESNRIVVSLTTQVRGGAAARARPALLRRRLLGRAAVAAAARELGGRAARRRPRGHMAAGDGARQWQRRQWRGRRRRRMPLGAGRERARARARRAALVERVAEDAARLAGRSPLARFVDRTPAMAILSPLLDRTSLLRGVQTLTAPGNASRQSFLHCSHAPSILSPLLARSVNPFSIARTLRQSFLHYSHAPDMPRGSFSLLVASSSPRRARLVASSS